MAKVKAKKKKELEFNSTFIEQGTGVARNHCAIAEGLPKGGRSLVPTMEAINKKKKDFTAISTFSGCGGASVGLKMAGFNVLYANEFIPAAQDTYKANNPNTFLDGSDIRTIDPKSVLKQFGLKRGELDLFEGSPPCFVAGTMIHTSDGFKPIEEIFIGDEVLTHTQSFHKVYDTMVRHYEGNMVSIKTMSSCETHATPEHPYYVRRKTGNNKYSLGEPSWVEAKDLVKGDYVGIAVNQLTNDPEWSGIDRLYFNTSTRSYEAYDTVCTLPVHDEDFWWIVGRYLGDGWMRYSNNDPKSYNKKKPRAIVVICCDKTDGGLELEQIVSKFESCGLKYKVSERRTAYRVSLSSKEFCEFLLPFGRGAANKRVPGSVLSLNKSLLKKFLQGYISADGSRRGRGHYRFSTVSKELSLGIVHCVNKVFGVSSGKIGCLSKEQQEAYGCNVIEGRVCNVKDKYSAEFRFFANDSKTHYIKDESGIIWVPIKNIEHFEYSGNVYNFSVEEDETYTANNIIVHNCKGFSTAGIKEEGWNKEVLYSDGVTQRVDDLFDEYIRMLKFFKSKVFIAENVSGLVKGNSRGMFLEILKDFKACGYQVKAALIDPTKLGLPQTRERLIYVGVRDDLAFEPVFPTPRNKKPVTVRDLLPNVVMLKTKVRGVLTYVDANRPSPTIVASDFDTGENASFSCGGWIEDNKGRRRKYNLNELRRLMSFPDDFILTGNPRQQWERLGRSHAPLQVYHLAKTLREKILIPYYESKGAKFTDNIR